MLVIRSLLRRGFLRFLLLGVLVFLLSVSFAPLPRTAPTVRNHDTGQFFLPDYGQTLVAAHRVGKSAAPENTLMAVQECLESRTPPDILETDLQLTKDGELVLYHSLFLDENSDAVEAFGRRRVTVFSKSYDELRRLNMGETFEHDGEYPYAGLRGDDIPDNLRIVKLADALDWAESMTDGRLRYILEIKYPFPWASKMIDKLYAVLHERQMEDRVIVASFWPDVGQYIDLHYAGKLLRSANPAEIIELYGCYKRNANLSRAKLPYMALQIPYYWRHGERLIFANLGETGFIDYAHRYSISVQYYTLSRSEDMQDLVRGGADVLMADRPERAFDAIRNTELFEEEAS